MSATAKGERGANAPDTDPIRALLSSGMDDEDNDPFAQLGDHDNDEQAGEMGSSEASETPAVPLPAKGSPSPAKKSHVDAEVAEAGDGETAEGSDESTAGKDNPHSTEMSQTAHPVDKQPAASSWAEKDFSDLLAEFEAEDSLPGHGEHAHGEGDAAEMPSELHTDGQDEALNSGLRDQSGQVNHPSLANTSSLFGHDSGPSAFDDFLTQDTAPIHSTSHSSPAPDLSIENSIEEDAFPQAGGAGDTSVQSLFSDNSDWLGDTTFDQSIQIPSAGARSGEEPQPMSAFSEDGSAPVEAVIPEGWVDDDGNFHYYTPEEREAVKMTMLGQSGWNGSAMETHPPDLAMTPNYSPAMQTGYSENAARRTPNPESFAYQPAHSNDLYAPQRSLQTPTTAGSYFDSQYTASSAASTDPYSAYSPAIPAQRTAANSAPSPYAPSSHNPYAPAPSAYNAAAPLGSPYYQPPTSGAGASSSSSLLPAIPPVSQPPPKPKPIQRVASTAYDPPFLKTQKSIARLPSAAPVQLPFPKSTPTPPPPPAAPPQGPPRRPKSAAPPSASAPRPSLISSPPAAPPPGPPNRPPSAARENDPYSSTGYAAIPRPPSALYEQESPYAPGRGHDSLAPSFEPIKPPSRPSSSVSARPPPRAPSYNAFDPPLRPSTASTPRPPARSPIPPSQPALAPPLKSAMSPPPPAGPPRGYPPGRGAPPPRRQTPSFAPPPAQPTPPPASRNVSEPSWASESFQAQSRPHENDLPESRTSWEEHPTHSEPSLQNDGGGDMRSRYEEYGEEDSQAQYAFDSDQRPLANDPEDESYSNVPHTDEGHGSYLPNNESGYETHQSSNVYSTQSPATEPYHPYSQSQDQSQEGPASINQDPYAPNASAIDAFRAYSPTHDRQEPAPSSSYDPYAPNAHASPPSLPQSSLGLSMDQPHAMPSADDHNSWAGTSQGDDSYSPYAPPRQSRSDMPPAVKTPSTHPPYDPYGLSSSSKPSDSPYARAVSPSFMNEYGASPQTHNQYAPLHAPSSDETYVPQQLLDQRPVSEDPLGRCTLAARNAPLAVFGFGGVLITAFPALANLDNETLGHSRTPSYGYASGRGQLWIRNVPDIVSTSALKSNDSVFPGPLILDTAAAKGAVGDKKRKEAVLAYLQARADEIEKGLPYLKSSASAARREEEGKLVLVRLLAALVTGDGRLSGSTQAEAALRSALNGTSSTPASSTFSPATAASTTNSFSTNLYSNTASTVKSASATPAQLSQLSTLLQSGDKLDAVRYAASHGLWSHALIISSSVDQELWKEIVTEFSKAELDVPGLAGVKASYALFSGATLTSVDGLIAASQIQDDKSSDQWREVVAAVVFNGKPSDLACLDGLASQFKTAGLINAAHACSLLSPASPFSDTTPGSLEKPIELVQNPRDEDAIIFAEIAEYARSLIAVPKGQELPFPGLPQLLPYKLQRAWWAAELGDQDLARRYCNAVGAASKPGKNIPSLLPPQLLNSLGDLLERITGDPSTAPANVIGGRKAAKPGLDKLGSWIEGRLTKFIAGEEDGDVQAKPLPPRKDAAGSAIGPFSHFSTISPAPSNSVTRATSSADFGGGLSVPSESRGTSPLHQSREWGGSQASPGDGEQHGSYGGYGGYGGYGYSASNQEEGSGDQDDTPLALAHTGDGSEELLNPMAALSLGSSSMSASQNDYGPPVSRQNVVEEDDEDDLGFGNTALSRNRTPQPAAEASTDGKKEKANAPPAKAAKPESGDAGSLSKGAEQKSGWLRGWFGKKEGEQASGSGPIRAKLGEENAMVFDPELKRWVVKGAKAEPLPAAPPPPPRAQTVSPSRLNRESPPGPGNRASSATPPSSQLSRSLGPSAGAGSRPPSRPSAASLAFTETPDGGIKRQKSALADDLSLTQPGAVSGSAPGGTSAPGPPRPPSSRAVSGAGPPGASLDDLLSRPPSKRPASAAKKSMRNRYVDVLQPGSEG